jgi:hypothetical protein
MSTALLEAFAGVGGHNQEVELVIPQACSDVRRLDLSLRNRQ